VTPKPGAEVAQTPNSASKWKGVERVGQSCKKDRLLQRTVAAFGWTSGAGPPPMR